MIPLSGSFWGRCAPFGAAKTLAAPENCFLLLALVFGSLYFWAVPPFQSPDEIGHFLSAYHVSEGGLLPEGKDAKGPFAFVPTAVRDFSKFNEYLPFHPRKRQDRGDFQNQFRMEMDVGDRVKINVNTYSPPQYGAQALGMAAARFVFNQPISLYYAGRLSNFLFWLLAIYSAIRISPVLKWPFFLLALLPMSLFQAVSVSPDAFAIACSFLLAAQIFRIAYGKRRPGWGDWVGIFTTAALLTASKVVFWPMSFLVLLIPWRKAQSPGRYGAMVALTILGSLSAAYGWTLLVPVGVHPAMVAINPGGQLQHILAAPLDYVMVLLRTLFRHWPDYRNMFIGVLGWLDTPLAQPLYQGISWLLLLALVHERRRVTSAPWQRGLAGMILGGITGLIFTAMYIYWTPVGHDFVAGVQGRYFLPFAFLTYLALGIPVRIRKFPWLRQLGLVFPLGMAYVLWDSVQTLVARYHG